jgi:hypothetical protein
VVDVHLIEQGFALCLVLSDAVIFQGLEEFLNAKRAGIVIVNGAEAATDASDAASSSLLNALSHKLENIWRSRPDLVLALVLGRIPAHSHFALNNYALGLTRLECRSAGHLQVIVAGSLGPLARGLMRGNVLAIDASHHGGSVEVILPLLSGILHELSRRWSSSLTFSEFFFGKVHVPDARDERLELLVFLELCVDVLMVVNEVLERNFAIVGKALVGAVQISEKVEEFKSGFLNGLETRLHIGVARRVKLTLHLIEVEGAVFARVEPAERLLDQTTAVVAKLTDNGVHEFLERNQTIIIVIKCFEEKQNFRLAHARHLKVIDGILEFLCIK